MSWLKVCPTSDIEDDEGFRVETVRPPIAIYRHEDEYFATADTCSHADSSLSEGYVEDGTVECVWHLAKFCLRTGRALTLPATAPIRTYEVNIEDDHVHVRLDDSVLLLPDAAAEDTA